MKSSRSLAMLGGLALLVSGCNHIRPTETRTGLDSGLYCTFVSLKEGAFDSDPNIERNGLTVSVVAINGVINGVPVDPSDYEEVGSDYLLRSLVSYEIRDLDVDNEYASLLLRKDEEGVKSKYLLMTDNHIANNFQEGDLVDATAMQMPPSKGGQYLGYFDCEDCAVQVYLISSHQIRRHSDRPILEIFP